MRPSPTSAMYRRPADVNDLHLPAGMLAAVDHAFIATAQDGDLLTLDAGRHRARPGDEGEHLEWDVHAADAVEVGAVPGAADTVHRGTKACVLAASDDSGLTGAKAAATLGGTDDARFGAHPVGGPEALLAQLALLLDVWVGGRPLPGVSDLGSLALPDRAVRCFVPDESVGDLVEHRLTDDILFGGTDHEAAEGDLLAVVLAVFEPVALTEFADGSGGRLLWQAALRNLPGGGVTASAIAALSSELAERSERASALRGRATVLTDAIVPVS